MNVQHRYVGRQPDPTLKKPPKCPVCNGPMQQLPANTGDQVVKHCRNGAHCVHCCLIVGGRFDWTDSNGK